MIPQISDKYSEGVASEITVIKNLRALDHNSKSYGSMLFSFWLASDGLFYGEDFY